MGAHQNRPERQSNLWAVRVIHACLFGHDGVQRVPNTYMMVGARSASGSWNNGTDRQYAVAFIGSGVHRRELRDDGDPLQQLREGRQRWDRVLLKKALVETRKPDRSEAD